MNRMNGNCLLSVIVPAHGAGHLLPDTLAALRNSTLPAGAWELIVVDDASRDATAEVAAAFTDQVLRLTPVPRGPGAARNAGAERARGTWLLFIDADVRVHPDTLERFVQATRRHPDAVAIFGAYDDQPAAPGLVSQYRNLLHRYVHLRGAGPATTFWAGCGGVRRDAFHAVNGFDTTRFSRPQIEDIELGYRLRDRGGQIILDPTIQGTHLKRWTLTAMMRTDILDRGIPWTRLLLERRGRNATGLNTGVTEQVKVALAGLALVTLGAAAVLATPRFVLPGMALLGLLVLGNWRAFWWYRRTRGIGFALATVPLMLNHYICCAVAAGLGILGYLRSGMIGAQR